jgi:hypothetical protein
VGFTPQFITHLLIDFPLSLKSAPQAQAHGAMQIHIIILHRAVLVMRVYDTRAK